MREKVSTGITPWTPFFERKPPREFLPAISNGGCQSIKFTTFVQSADTGMTMDHGREHIRDRERLDVAMRETGRQHQHAAAGGEVRLHTGARQREDQPGAEKEKKLKDKLRRATNATTLPSEEAKIAAVKKSRMAFVQSTVVAGQPGIERTENARAARADENDNAHELMHARLIHGGAAFRQKPRNGAVHFSRSGTDRAVEMDGLADHEAQDHREDPACVLTCRDM